MCVFCVLNEICCITYKLCCKSKHVKRRKEILNSYIPKIHLFLQEYECDHNVSEHLGVNTKVQKLLFGLLGILQTTHIYCFATQLSLFLWPSLHYPQFSAKMIQLWVLARTNLASSSFSLPMQSSLWRRKKLWIRVLFQLKLAKKQQ